MSYSNREKWSWRRGKALGFARGASYQSTRLSTSFLQSQSEIIARQLLSSKTFEDILSSPNFLLALAKIINDIWSQVTGNYVKDFVPEGQQGLVGKEELVPQWVYDERVAAGWDPDNLKTQMYESVWYRFPNFPDPRPSNLIPKPLPSKDRVQPVPSRKQVSIKPVTSYEYTPPKSTYTYVPEYVEVDPEEVAEREAEVEYARVQQEEDPQEYDIPIGYGSGSYVPYATDENEDWL